MDDIPEIVRFFCQTNNITEIEGDILDTISILNDSSWFRNFAIYRGHSSFQGKPLRNKLSGFIADPILTCNLHSIQYCDLEILLKPFPKFRD